MRSIAIGLAAAFFAAALAPVAAYAADKPAPAAAKTADPTADPKKHQQGTTEVPPIIQKTAINCTPTDAIFYGAVKGKTEAGKDTTFKYYEVACQEGLGYVLRQDDAGDSDAYDCVAMTKYKPKAGEPDKGQVYCRLAPNADPLKGLQPIAAKAGAGSCTINQANYMGSSPADKVDEYEIGCADGDAYILQAPRVGSPKPAVAANCFRLDAGKCAFFPKDKFIAKLSSLAQPAGRACQVTDGRYIGTSGSNKNSYYEIACTDEKAGFVLQVDASDKFVGAIDCARASAIAGGCTLTSAAAAQTAENGTYTKLAQQIGYACNVKAYHSFGQDQATGREVVELACSDHDDGAIALLPVDKGQKGEHFDCVRAELRGLKCALTPPAATYAKLSSQVSAAGKSCQVSNARAVGKSNDGAEFVEVACSGGAGQMLEFPPDSDKVKTVTACAQAAGIGGGCKLGK
jgi:hypothetical protein